MQEIIDIILSSCRAMWLKRWYALSIAWFVCILGWAVVMNLPNQYEASARVHIDTQSFLRPMLRGLAYSSSVDQQVRLMVATLLSRPNLEKIARITDLDLRAKSDQDMESLLDQLENSIQLSKVDRQQDLYQVSYSDEDRELSKRVVQAVLTVFIERTMGQNREQSNMAVRFLEAEIQEYESRLQEAEQKTVDFKRKNIGYLSASGADYYQRLQQAMAEQELAKLSLIEAVKQRDNLVEQIEDEEDSDDSLFFGVGGPENATVYDFRIATLQAKLDEMFLKFTEKHPDVITIRSQIADLEQKREEELANMADLSNPENPLVQSLKLSASQADAQVAALTARVKSYQDKVKNIQNLVNTAPAIEAELADLNRDYGVIQGKYNELLNRREQTRITQKANLASDEIEFKVIDPPRVPFEPSGPPRILFMSVVLIAGIAIGMGFSLFLVLIKPAFAGTRALALETGLAVLGAVSFFEGPGDIASNRRSIILFASLAFLLLVAYSGILLYQLLITPPGAPI